MEPAYCVALVHYHLNGGGVTRVIEQQAEALLSLKLPFVIFCGENRLALDLPVHIIPELQFSELSSDDKLQQVKESIHSTLKQQFGNQNVIFHFHNHSIGLNPLYEEIVDYVVQTHPTILQIHDFIEDGRHQNTRNVTDWDKLYPSGAHIHYATINSRDLGILKNSGAHHVHLLPNCYRPVATPEQTVAPLIFYPVQALRRKNIGELLLLSLFTPVEYQYAIGLTPQGGEELINLWEAIATKHQLPILFNTSNRILAPNSQCSRFSSWYSSASHIVTTSIQEGFGMAFIEPIHYGKPLFGRDIPDITASIKESGVQHEYLYSHLFIDLELLAAADIIATQELDFGTLHELNQIKIIAVIAENSNYQSNCSVMQNGSRKPLKTFITAAINQASALDRECIQPWSQESLQSNLTKLYQQVAHSSIEHSVPLDCEKIKQAFEKLPKFSLKEEPLDLISLEEFS